MPGSAAADDSPRARRRAHSLGIARVGRHRRQPLRRLEQGPAALLRRRLPGRRPPASTSSRPGRTPPRPGARGRTTRRPRWRRCSPTPRPVDDRDCAATASAGTRSRTSARSTARERRPAARTCSLASTTRIHAAGGTSVAEDLKGYGAITQSTASGGFGFDAQWDGFGYTVTPVLTAYERRLARPRHHRRRPAGELRRAIPSRASSSSRTTTSSATAARACRPRSTPRTRRASRRASARCSGPLR